MYKAEAKVVDAQSAYLQSLRKRQLLIRFTQLSLLILLFVVWEIAAQLRIIDPFIFSQPSRMFAALCDMSGKGILWQHIWVTTWETIVGFVLGTLFGTLLAVLLWWNNFLSKVSEPYLVVLNALPKTALAPILIVWMGNNQKSIIAVALLTSVVVTVMTVLAGFLSVDEEKIKLVHTFGGTKKQVLQKVVLPASVPTVINALKINVGLSFVGVIVGEFLVAKEGLGYLIVYGSQIFKLDWVMLSVVILAVLSAVLYKLITLLEKRICKLWN